MPHICSVLCRAQWDDTETKMCLPGVTGGGKGGVCICFCAFHRHEFVVGRQPFLTDNRPCRIPDALKAPNRSNSMARMSHLRSISGRLAFCLLLRRIACPNVAALETRLSLVCFSTVFRIDSPNVSTIRPVEVTADVIRMM